MAHPPRQNRPDQSQAWRGPKRPRPKRETETREVPGLPARRAALKIIDAVLHRGEPLDRVANGATQGLPAQADRALAIGIAIEVLRHLPALDALIDGAMRNPVDSNVKVRSVMRLALVQHFKMATPPHAILATALPLLEGGPRRLAHGVLGTIFRSEARLPDIAELPDPVVARWQAAWGEAMVAAASEAFGHQPPIDLTLRDAGETARWTQALGGTSLMPGHVRLDTPGSIAALDGYDEGAWWVQDIAAAIPARLLGQGEGRSVLDLCAAPGGKSLQLAAAGWEVVAVDKSAKRLERMAENIARSGLAVTTTAADILEWQPDRPADAVLLDAPCSATGIFRRHPDVLYRVRDDDIAALAELQTACLARAAEWVTPGGRLIYATCSLEPAEGEAQAQAFIAAHAGWSIDPIAADEVAPGMTIAPEGWLRIAPPTLAEEGGADGFFIARFKRAD
jgi:16S rRNA (cytosine967-C5)-methyltransferase